MTKEELAATLNGRQYREEMTMDEERAAKDAGLVVIYGASDDLMEMRGAVRDEICGPDFAYFERDGILSNDCEDEECPYFDRLKQKATTVEAVWGSEGYSWIYKTTIPHAPFDIMEDDDKYCRGIVFALGDVP